MQQKFDQTKVSLSELNRQLKYGTTMLGRLREKNRKAEKAYEAKLLNLQAQIAQLEAESDSDG